jgi:hypothetical protein
LEDAPFFNFKETFDFSNETSPGADRHFSRDPHSALDPTINSNRGCYNIGKDERIGSDGQGTADVYGPLKASKDVEVPVARDVAEYPLS